MAFYADGNGLSFDGCFVGILRFLSYYENFVTRGESGDNRAVELLGFLDGERFEFYYDTFALDAKFTEEHRDYSVVIAVFMERFGFSEDPEEHIRQAVLARLDNGNLVGS